jgi:hypothetical protein
MENSTEKKGGSSFTWILLALGGFFLFQNFKKGIDAAYNKFEWKYSGVKMFFAKVKFKEALKTGIPVTLAIYWNAHNKNDFPIELVEFKGKLMYGKQIVSELKLKESYRFEPNQENKFEVHSVTSIGAFLNNVINWNNTGRQLYKFRIVGFITQSVANAPNTTFAIDETIQFAADL